MISRVRFRAPAPRLGPKHTPFLRRICVSAGAEQKEQSNGCYCSPVLARYFFARGYGGEVRYANERQHDRNEGRRCGRGIEGRYVRLLKWLARALMHNLLLQSTNFIASPNMYTRFWSAIFWGSTRKKNAIVMWKSDTARISVYAEIIAILPNPKSSTLNLL